MHVYLTQHLSTFCQVFLRSKALELALDASARSAELRLALRTYALAVPARWVMETGNGDGQKQGWVQVFLWNQTYLGFLQI